MIGRVPPAMVDGVSGVSQFWSQEKPFLVEDQAWRESGEAKTGLLTCSAEGIPQIRVAGSRRPNPHGARGSEHRTKDSALTENTIPAQFSNRFYSGEVRRSGIGDITLRIVPVSENGPAAGDRRVAAFVYEIAAEMERRSEALGGRWVLSAEPNQAKIRIEIADAEERARVEALLAEVMDQFDLG